MTSDEQSLSDPVSPGQVILVQATVSSLKISWVFESPHNPNTGVRIKWGRKPYDSANDKYQMDLPFTTPAGKYTITALAPDTLYEIFVWGTVGEVESRNRGRVEGKTTPAASGPASPTNLNASPSGYSMKLTWSGAANASSYKISYGTEPGGPATQVTSITTESTISELRSNTPYYFEVRSSNNNGDSEPARVVKQTLPVPPTPADLRAAPAIVSMDLTWSASAGAAFYIIHYKVEPDGEYQRQDTDVAHHTLTGLTKNTLYAVMVSAANANGASLPAHITQRTQEGPELPSTPGAISTFPTRDTVQVIWEPPRSAEFQVSYGLEDHEREVIDTQITKNMTYTFRGLQPDTRYFIDVSGSNASGVSEPRSNSFTTRTFEAPRNLSAIELTDESATWQWSAGADYPAGTRYEVYLGDRRLDTVPDTHYVLTDLIEKTEYLFKVRAIAVEGYCSDYLTDNFKTLAYSGMLICSPGNLKGIRQSATIGILTWDEPYATCTTCPDAVGYEISGAGIETFEVTRPPCEIKNLDAQLEYWLAVRAKGGGNNISQASRVLIERRPGKPEALQVTAITASYATLSWSVATDDVAVLGYLVYRNGTFVGATSSFEYHLQALEPGTEYTVEVRARTIALTLSDPAQKRFFTIEENDGVPNAPSNFQCSQNGLLSTLKWDAPTEGAQVTGYRVALTTPMGIEVASNVTRPMLQTVLVPRTRYKVDIVANNAAGYSESLLSELTTN
ncbi:fibronectin type III domain-containing protein [Pseudomonas sp. TNT3]|uniref:fibronectin type III domain-containing protein n=1 Tax=Pseudomonas sp. TNT3 TaxID=2654097 RepID=UPI00139113DC|nr:fibronectin type III domain-containing protein [Pseudomonas sp. TNT3]KAI2693171.1 fibronectin type III domain-containing protein [Pseudomonas sp. TNT3]